MGKFLANEYTFEPVRSVSIGDVVYVKCGSDYEEVVIRSIKECRKWHDYTRPLVRAYCCYNYCYWIEDIFKIKDSYTRNAGVSFKNNFLSKEEQREEFIKLCEEIDSMKTPRFNMKDRY